MSRSLERLRLILEEQGADAKKSLGQNFLISDQVIEKIVNAVVSLKPGSLLEIGPGPGSLTFSLRENFGPEFKDFLLIELDRVWSQFWRDKGMTVIEADALQIPWKPLVLDDTVLVSNLPYQISSTLVIDRSMDEKRLQAMVLMFQKEVAQKIRGNPKDELYGFLSVIAQSFWKIDTVCDAGPRDFSPPPKVASRVLRFLPLPESEVPQNPKQYLNFVKMAFQQRRKTLRSNWEGYLNQKPQGWERVLKRILEMGFTEKLRAEELNTKQFVELYHLWQGN